MVNNTYQLLNELRTGGTSYQRAWVYDEVGNRLTQWDGAITTTYTYNNANQLTQEVVSGTTYTYTFDANGNQTGKTDGTNNWAWVYNYENQQISYTDPISTNNATYTYNAGGARISKTVNSVTEKYILDGANVIADYDGSNNLMASYVTPFLDQNLLVNRQTGGNWQTYYFMQDGLGSVRNLVSSVQSVVNSYDYYAFGEVLSQTEGVSNRYKFTSREWDAESQTNYFRARQQDPRLGRFLQPDPMGYNDSVNLYSYVRNNPVNLVDPTGLQDYGTDALGIPKNQTVCPQGNDWPSTWPPAYYDNANICPDWCQPFASAERYKNSLCGRHFWGGPGWEMNDGSYCACPTLRKPLQPCDPVTLTPLTPPTLPTPAQPTTPAPAAKPENAIDSIVRDIRERCPANRVLSRAQCRDCATLLGRYFESIFNAQGLPVPSGLNNACSNAASGTLSGACAQDGRTAGAVFRDITGTAFWALIKDLFPAPIPSGVLPPK